VNEGFPAARRSATKSCRCSSWSPSLPSLDETDSGLDIERHSRSSRWREQPCATRTAQWLLVTITSGCSITSCDHVHVLSGGRILKSGDRSLAVELERRGYDLVQQESKVA